MRIMRGRGGSHSLKVEWVGSFEPGFTRNRRLAELMALADMEVDRVHVRVWPTDKLRAFRKRWRLAGRMLIAYPALFARLLVRRAPDVYLVTYPGWFDMFCVRAIGLLKGVPIVFDPFISLNDSIVGDRGLSGESSLVAMLTLVVDKASIKMASVVLVDSHAHAAFLAQLTEENPAKFTVLQVGADESLFTADPGKGPDEGAILYYGTYLPLHGTRTIVHAAALLESAATIRMIGDGQDRVAAEGLAREQNVANIEFVNRLEQSDLVAEIRRSRLCLGQFGTTEKAGRVNAQKIYEVISVGRAVVTMDSEALRMEGLASHVATVPPGDPAALANAIDGLLKDDEERLRLAMSGHQFFVENVKSERLSSILKTAMSRVTL